MLFSSAAAGLIAAAAVAALLTQADPADAVGLIVREEPGNALSLPTWAIHVSSVIEWIAAMGLVWRYAEVTGAPTGTPQTVFTLTTDVLPRLYVGNYEAMLIRSIT